MKAKILTSVEKIQKFSEDQCIEMIESFENMPELTFYEQILLQIALIRLCDIKSF